MDGYVTIGTELDTTSFDAQIDYVKSQLEEIEYQLKQADMGFETDDVQKLEANYEKLNDKLRKLVQKKEEFNNVPMKHDYTQIKKDIDGIGKGLTKIIRKARQWTLAIFGIRGAYMLIRNAINTITEGDEQLKADIDYMKGTLAYALEPIVRWIVNLMKKLMQYVQYIAKAWFGINIFENANKSLEDANESAKELKKTITGFDEMNVLQDNTQKETAKPSFDFGEGLGNGDVPDWIKWIANNGDEVARIIAAITGAILALKLGISGVQSLGVGLAIYGILELIKDVKDFIDDQSWEGFFKILGDILIVVGGLYAVLTGGWIGILIAGIGLLTKLIIENWDTISKILGQIWDWIYEHVIEPIWNGICWLFEAIYKAISREIEVIRDIIDFIVNFFKSCLELTWQFLCLLIDEAVSDFQEFFALIGNLVKGTWDFITGIISGAANWIKEKVIDPISNFFSDLWDGIKNSFSSAWDFITSSFSKGGKMFNGLKEGIVNTFKSIVNALITGINSIIKVPFDKINGLLNTIRNVKIPVINKKPFKGLWSQNPLPVPKIPKLAVGGIVNMPGSGVMIGNAIAGERGAEGVIPLTDSQQMQLLGQAIGKYITINANITNSMNGRVISRELQKIQNQDNFAFNR